MKFPFYYIVLLITTNLFAQIKEEKIYLDSLKNVTTETNHVYYRILKENSSKKSQDDISKDYYKSGKIQYEGFYLNSKKDSLKYIHYYETGAKKGESFYSEGSKVGMKTNWYENGNIESAINYQNDSPVGKYDLWYENGKKKQEGENIKFKDSASTTYLEKINQFWDKNNIQKVKDGNGFYEKDEKALIESGMVKNGFRDGFWKGTNFLKNKKDYSFYEKYENGKFISGTSIDLEKIEHQYTYVYNGILTNELSDFRRFVQRTLVVPEVDFKVEGRVVVEFVIEKNGTLTNLKVIKDMGWGTGQAVKDAILKYDKQFSPIKYRGIPIRTRFSFPVFLIIDPD